MGLLNHFSADDDADFSDTLKIRIELAVIDLGSIGCLAKSDG